MAYSLVLVLTIIVLAAAGRKIYVRVWATWLVDLTCTCTERECKFVVRVGYLIDIDNFYLLVNLLKWCVMCVMMHDVMILFDCRSVVGPNCAVCDLWILAMCCLRLCNLSSRVMTHSHPRLSSSNLCSNKTRKLKPIAEKHEILTKTKTIV